jgi:hypothetical protein
MHVAHHAVVAYHVNSRATRPAGASISRRLARAQLRRRFIRQLENSGLRAERDLDQLLPLDNDAAFEAAQPTVEDGKLRLDGSKTAAREAEMVKAAMVGNAVAVIVLGGGQDLSDQVRKLSGGKCEYIRVRTASCK